MPNKDSKEKRESSKSKDNKQQPTLPPKPGFGTIFEDKTYFNDDTVPTNVNSPESKERPEKPETTLNINKNQGQDFENYKKSTSTEKSTPHQESLQQMSSLPKPKFIPHESSDAIKMFINDYSLTLFNKEDNNKQKKAEKKENDSKEKSSEKDNAKTTIPSDLLKEELNKDSTTVLKPPSTDKSKNQTLPSQYKDTLKEGPSKETIQSNEDISTENSKSKLFDFGAAAAKELGDGEHKQISSETFKNNESINSIRNESSTITKSSLNSSATDQKETNDNIHKNQGSSISTALKQSSTETSVNQMSATQSKDGITEMSSQKQIQSNEDIPKSESINLGLIREISETGPKQISSETFKNNESLHSIGNLYSKITNKSLNDPKELKPKSNEFSSMIEIDEKANSSETLKDNESINPLKVLSSTITKSSLKSISDSRELKTKSIEFGPIFEIDDKGNSTELLKDNETIHSTKKTTSVVGKSSLKSLHDPKDMKTKSIEFAPTTFEIDSKANSSEMLKDDENIHPVKNLSSTITKSSLKSLHDPKDMKTKSIEFAPTTFDIDSKANSSEMLKDDENIHPVKNLSSTIRKSSLKSLHDPKEMKTKSIEFGPTFEIDSKGNSSEMLKDDENIQPVKSATATLRKSSLKSLYDPKDMKTKSIEFGPTFEIDSKENSSEMLKENETIHPIKNLSSLVRKSSLRTSDSKELKSKSSKSGATFDDLEEVYPLSNYQRHFRKSFIKSDTGVEKNNKEQPDINISQKQLQTEAKPPNQEIKKHKKRHKKHHNKSYARSEDEPKIYEPLVLKRENAPSIENFVIPNVYEEKENISEKPKKSVPTWFDYKLAREIERRKVRRQMSVHKLKFREKVKSTTSLINLIIIFDCINRLCQLIFSFNVKFYKMYELNLRPENLIRDDLIVEFCIGSLGCFIGWLADSHIGKYWIVLYANFIAIGGSLMLAVTISLRDSINYMVKNVFYSVSTLCFYCCRVVNPAQTFLVLEQCSIPQSTKQIRKACVLMYWLRNVFQIIYEMIIMTFYREETLPQTLSLVSCGLHLTYIVFLIIVAPRLNVFPYENNAVNKILCKNKKKIASQRRGSIDFHDSQRRSNKFYKTVYSLSPFILYFLIAQFIYIPWFVRLTGSTDTEYQLSISTVNITLCAMAIITIPLMEGLIYPLILRTKFNYLKLFAFGIILLGFSFIFSLFVFIKTEMSLHRFIRAGTGNMVILNGLQVAVRINSSWTGVKTIKPLSITKLKALPVNTRTNTRISVKVRDRDVNYWKRIFIYEFKTTVFVISDRYRFIRVTGFEKHLADEEMVIHLSKVICYTSTHYEPTNITFNLVKLDEESQRIIKKERKNKFYEELFEKYNVNSTQLSTPKFGEQSTAVLKAGTYEVDLSAYGMGIVNYTLKSRTLHRFLIHNTGTNTLFKEFVNEKKKVLSSFWDTPVILFYVLSTNTILISYTIYVYIYAPDKIKTFTYGIVSYDNHIVPAIHALYYTAYHKLTTESYVIGIFIYMLLCFLFMYITTKNQIAHTQYRHSIK